MALKKPAAKEPPMNFAQYTILSRATADKSRTPAEVWPTTLAGLAGELGEIFDLLKKHRGHGHELSNTSLIKEAGDFGWYCAEAVTFLDIKLIDNRVMGVPIKHLAAPLPAAHYLHRAVGDFGLNFACTEDEFATDVYEAGAKVALLKVVRAWFQLCDVLNLDRPMVYQANLDKLNARYPNGFSSEASINRVV